MESLSITNRAPLLSYSGRSSNIGRLLKRWRLGLTIFLSFMALISLILVVMPRSYDSSAEFLVGNDRVNTPIDSNTNTQSIVYLDDVSEARINTEVALLTNNDLLREVVRQTKMADRIGLVSWAAEKREEAALERLRDNLVVSPIKKSALIRVTYRSRSPSESLAVLNALSHQYLEAHLRLRGTPATYNFFRDLWEKTAAERQSAEMDLANFKLEHNIVELPEEKTIALQHDADLEKQFAEVQSAANRSANEASKLQLLIASTPENIIGAKRSVPNQSEIEQLSTILANLQNKKVEAASRYLPQDRVVRDLDDQIIQTKAALNSASAHNTEEVSTISNPVLSTARSDALHAQFEEAGYEAEAITFAKQMSSNRRKLITLDEQTNTYNHLTEEVSRLTSLDHDYHQKTDAARVNLLLDQNHISNVTLAEKPFVSNKATMPKVGAVLAIGIFWSLLASIATIFVIDRTRKRVRSVFELEKALGAPVLAFISNENRKMKDQVNTTPEVFLSMYEQPSRSTWRIA